MEFKVDLDNMFDDILDEKIPDKHKFEILTLDKRLNGVGPYFSHFEAIKRVFTTCENYKGKLFLCGGWLRFFLNGYIKQPPNGIFAKLSLPNKPTIPAKDVDLYCKDEDTFKGVKHIFRYKLHFRKQFETENAITYKRNLSSMPPFQLIKPMQKGKLITMGSLEEILRNFDFTIIRVGMDYDLMDKMQALVDVDFRRDELNHDIVIKNIHCPISSLQRMMKYYKKGYSVKAQEIIKLFEDWDNRDAKYKNELKTFFANLSKLSPTQVKNTYARMNFD